MLSKLAVLTLCFIMTFSCIASATSVTDSAKIKKLIYTAVRTNSPPKIDGSLDDPCWKNVPAIHTTIMFAPDWGKKPTQVTDAYVLYDNQAIYVGAYMHDSNAAHIAHQLSQRDDPNALADNFIVGLDTYHDGINGYRFMVTAAGVQYDEKASPSNPHDASWDAVWESSISIRSDGWVCEMKIPYSALRFSSKEEQEWGLQIGRNIIRTGELDLWNPSDPKIIGAINQWGVLGGLKDIEPPLRLSLSPYLTLGYQASPLATDPVTYEHDKAFSGGLDLKYGLNESFTLDATLIPDFGQVQSDNVVLNISPFETKFDEKRPFFTEGTELFNQDFSNGNNNGSPQLFYSRRIGGTPVGYYDVADDLPENDTVIKNPGESKLVNAIKLSGRTNGKLGIGILNAITKPSFATILDGETGGTYSLQTNPWTNYNVIVFDQSLRNNSKISFENTNVWRSGNARDADVGSVHFDFRDRKSIWELQGFVNGSFIKDTSSTGIITGEFHQLNLSHNKGFWNEYFNHHFITSQYDQNDLGILYYNNEMLNGIGFSYNNQQLKSGPYNYVNFWGSVNYYNRVQPVHYEKWETDCGLFLQQRNFVNYGIDFYTNPFQYYDYYEPRVEGRYYIQHRRFNINTWLNSDYRKRFSVSLTGDYADGKGPKNPYLEFDLFPQWLASQHITLQYGYTMSYDQGTFGFANFDENDSIIFGARNTSTVINTFTLKYVFNPKMNVSFRARYYWSKVVWTHYYQLQPDGTLGWTDYHDNNDINFNIFNIDAVYAWEFAPGSFLNVIWKNSIGESDSNGADNYFKNVNKTILAPETNGISVKVIYYIDYNRFRSKTS